MRRITPKYVQKGMILGQAVHDAYGNLLLDLGTSLNDRCREAMIQGGVPEIFIEDRRTDDVIVAPMFSPHQEGRLAKEFRGLLEEIREKRSLNKKTFEQVCVQVNEIAKNLSLEMFGEINVSYRISSRDYLYLQPVKTAILSLAIGHRLGIHDDELAELGTAALFKDIGYLYFPVETLNRVINSADEDPAIREHPALGDKLLNSTKSVSANISRAVLQHHERWNGSGYPNTLKGTQITRLAQIIALVDCFSNLLVERPRQEKYMTHQAVEFIMAYGGELFNPELVEFFVRVIPCFASGLMVQLNTGEVGLVSNPNLGSVARPVVRICRDAAGNDLDEPFDLDLAKAENQTRLITKILEYD